MSLTSSRSEAEQAFAEARRLDFNYDNLYAEYRKGIGSAGIAGTPYTVAYWPNGATLPQLKLASTGSGLRRAGIREPCRTTLGRSDRQLPERDFVGEEPGRTTSPAPGPAAPARGFDRANRREFAAAVSDLNQALGLDKENPQTYVVCGLTCCVMARDCHSRRMFADEEQQWGYAIQHLRQASWLDRGMVSEVRSPLEDATRSLARLRP